MPKTFKYKIETLCVVLSLFLAILTLPSSLYSWHHLPRWVPKVFAAAIEKMARNQRPVVHTPSTPPSQFQNSISKAFKFLRFKKQSSVETDLSKQAVTSSPLLISLKLSGIIAGSGERSQAIINDDIYSEGQRIAGYTLLRIDSSQVLLSKDGEKYSLTTEGIKKIPPASKPAAAESVTTS